MPELPEVETTRQGLLPALVGQQIVDITVRQPRLRQPVPEAIGANCRGQVVQALSRRSKYLLIQLAQGGLLVHLGMSGHLRIVPSGTLPGKHDHLDLILANNQTLRYHDPRRFGLWLWVNEPYESHPLLKHLGPEPLTDGFNAAYLQTRLRGKKQPTKTAIMDNAVVVGVGNIYASESLFRAGILPTRPAGTLELPALERLVTAIKTVLSEAIAAGGTTLKDFYASDGKPGYFTLALQVYGRKSAPCLHCGAEIQTQKLGGRSTFYCQVCQD